MNNPYPFTATGTSCLIKVYSRCRSLTKTKMAAAPPTLLVAYSASRLSTVLLNSFVSCQLGEDTRPLWPTAGLAQIPGCLATHHHRHRARD